MIVEQRYRAVVGYDGTGFWGYQVQKIGRTVQGEIEKTLKQITGMQIRIDGAGRTDSGVHAVGQVIAFNAVWKHTITDLHRAINALLPPDIVVSELVEAINQDFHPRFNALSRLYRYTVINQLWPDVLQRRYAYHIKKDLDVVSMNEAGRIFVGQHDFASFGKPPIKGRRTVRHIMKAEWSKQGNRLTFTIKANAFLYRMVRNIVGTVVQVGLGNLTAAEIKNILEARDLTLSAPPVPACGLCLIKVSYPGEDR